MYNLFFSTWIMTTHEESEPLSGFECSSFRLMCISCMLRVSSCTYISAARTAVMQPAKPPGLLVLWQLSSLCEPSRAAVQRAECWVRHNQALPEASSLIKEKWLGNSALSVPWFSICKTRMMVSPLSCRVVVKIDHIKGDWKGAQRLLGRCAM